MLACLLCWFVLFDVTGLFGSSFHLIDEHVLTEIHTDLTRPDASVGAVIRKWVALDLGERRFRPIYYTSRVLRTELFGLSWPAWSLYNAFLAASTSLCLFLFGTLLGFTAYSSFCLAALATLGRPSTVWWRLGTPETEGNFLLALTLLFIAWAVTAQGARRRKEDAAIVLALLASLTKEGMILYLPAIAAIRVWFPCWRYGWTLKSALRNAWPFVAALAVIAAIEVLILLLSVGIAGTGYAGVGAASFDFARLKSRVEELDSVASLRIPLAVLAIAIWARWRRARTEYTLAPLILGWVAFLAGAIPQVLLYAKSGWADHYFSPIVISCVLLMVLSIEYLRGINRWIYLGFALLLLLQINPRFRWTRAHAQSYAAQGVSLQNLLRSAAACARDDRRSLVVANPRVHYEEAFSLRTFLGALSNGERVYLATVGHADSAIFSDALAAKERDRSFINPKTLEDHYFRGDTLASLTPDERERVGAILILAPESLQNDFLAGASGWLHPARYRSTDFDLEGVQVRLLCLDR